MAETFIEIQIALTLYIIVSQLPIYKDIIILLFSYFKASKIYLIKK